MNSIDNFRPKLNIKIHVLNYSRILEGKKFVLFYNKLQKSS
jgi:hypothetical protein